MSIRHRMEAVSVLARRYADVFFHCWQNRHQLQGKALAAHEADFLPAALSLREKPVSPAGRFTAKALIALVVALISWSVIGKMDIVVNASGKIIPGGHTKTIACVDVASVRAIHVQEGQQVEAGQMLIELDTSMSDAERDKATGERSMSALEVAVARALIKAIDSGGPPRLERLPGIPADRWNTARLNLDARYADYLAKLNRIDGDIERFSQALRLAARQAEDYRELLKDHDVSHHAWLEKEQARVEIEGRLADARNQRSALVAETRRAAHDHWIEGSKTAASAHQEAIRAEAHSRLLRLTAPISGTVQQLNVHTIGGVVPAATPLMRIVPRESRVEVEALMENKDVGFVKEGQSAAVKIDAFEYTKYGVINGKVTHVSRDAIADEKRGLIYSTKILLDRSAIHVDGRETPLSAGMSVNVEIKTGDRRVIEYVLSPLLRHKRESLNER